MSEPLPELTVPTGASKFNTPAGAGFVQWFAAIKASMNVLATEITNRTMASVGVSLTKNASASAKYTDRAVAVRSRTLGLPLDKYAVRKSLPGVVRKVSFPTTGGVGNTGFQWQDAPINIIKNGKTYVTDLDVSMFKNQGGITRYVDTVNGNNANTGLSESLPKKTLGNVYTASANGDTIVILNDSGSVILRDNIGTFAWTKGVNLIARNHGVKIAFADNLVYTKTAGLAHTYQAARSNTLDVVDTKTTYPGVKYTKRTSAAEVDANAGSWYTDGTTIWVRALDSKAPDSAWIYALLAVPGLHFQSTVSAMTVYLEGIEVYGGQTGSNLTFERVTYNISGYGKDCGFHCSAQAAGELANSVNVFGADYAFFQDCRASYSHKDGFNYTPRNGVIPKFIEVDCHSWAHGIPNVISPNTHNASTAHAGVKGIRIGGIYHETMGAILADVNDNTQTLNYSCLAFDPLTTTQDSYQTVFCTQQSGSTMWGFGCTFFGGWWDSAALPGTAIILDETRMESSTGASYTTITNPA